ncbi:NAD(P)H-quinone oxidoreductase subunit L, chloroplastic [Amaranthus tricolor]|uniref:NAD(P)H-quinone oxidoreductase subunit L, chloroplastic n=1 Tax=Amaranthus tricolor TaxID=29722 RepID=UPI00258A1DB7|nr:NAD(P)H-quinone oxidoreductase subunit L, chloroplastic [Amaranthus tricolor]
MSNPISLHLQPLKALPSFSYSKCRPVFPISCTHKFLCSSKLSNGSILVGPSKKFELKSNWVFQQLGFLALTVAEPALAVTGVNNEEDIIWVLIKAAGVASVYFFVMPPIIMNWLRIRWYKRNVLEMYIQFMCVFIFFPGVLLWSPFINFRKFPRDPAMKYPWSKVENPVPIKGGGYLKYPWATLEDYESL